MKLKQGDRVVIVPPQIEFSTPDDMHGSLADSVGGRRATVVKPPWFLAMFDCYHVGLYVDDGKHAEVEVDWCQPLPAVDALAELADPPQRAKPWPPPKPKRTWWQKFADILFARPR